MHPYLNTRQPARDTCAWTFAPARDGSVSQCVTPHSFLLDIGNGYTPVCRQHLAAACRWAFSRTPSIDNGFRESVRVLPKD